VTVPTIGGVTEQAQGGRVTWVLCRLIAPEVERPLPKRVEYSNKLIGPAAITVP
jgi:hypothetical protein